MGDQSYFGQTIEAQKAWARWRKVNEAIVHLRKARDLLSQAESPRTAARVRLAMTSAGGAERHAYGRYTRLAP